MFIYIAFALFTLAMLLVLLSYSAWVQANLKWMTNFYFYILIGILLGCSLLMAAYILGKKMIPFT